MSHRLLGLRVLAALLAWQALGGIWHAALVLRSPPNSFGPLLFPIAEMAAAAAAGLTAVGLWRARKWAVRAYVGWAVLTFIAYVPLTMWIGLIAMDSSRSQSWRWLLPAAAILFAGGVLCLGWRYIRRELLR